MYGKDKESSHEMQGRLFVACLMNLVPLSIKIHSSGRLIWV